MRCQKHPESWIGLNGQGYCQTCAREREALCPSDATTLFARAKVDADPMAFAVRGAIFRGYYVFTRGNYYLTKDGKWTHGCTAPDDGNWWDTRGDAQRALEKFRLANDEVSHGDREHPPDAHSTNNQP